MRHEHIQHIRQRVHNVPEHEERITQPQQPLAASGVALPQRGDRVNKLPEACAESSADEQRGERIQQRRKAFLQPRKIRSKKAPQHAQQNIPQKHGINDDAQHGFCNGLPLRTAVKLPQQAGVDHPIQHREERRAQHGQKRILRAKRPPAPDEEQRARREQADCTVQHKRRRVACAARKRERAQAQAELFKRECCHRSEDAGQGGAPQLRRHAKRRHGGEGGIKALLFHNAS